MINEKMSTKIVEQWSLNIEFIHIVNNNNHAILQPVLIHWKINADQTEDMKI